MTTTLYGFRGCDMVKSAIRWLDANSLEYSFFDYRRQALPPAALDDWFARAGWQNVFNTNSTSFKQLAEAERANLDAKKARALILADTNMIKRPVLDTEGKLSFGFKPAAYAQMFGR